MTYKNWQSDSLDEIRGVNLLGNPIMCGACVVRLACVRACVRSIEDRTRHWIVVGYQITDVVDEVP